MDALFDIVTRLDDITIYEKENVIAFMYPNVYDDEEDEYHLCLEMWKGVDVYTLPQPILELTRHGGSFHGVFIEYINKKK